MWPIVGNLIGAGASLFGGLMGQQQSSQQFWQNVKLQQRAFKKQTKWNRWNAEFTKKQWKWAKHLTNLALRRSTLAWRVKDAQRAGIHPLFALGASPGASTPTAQVGNPSFATGGGSVGYSGDGGLASGIAMAGQQIGRAVEAYATQDQRNEVRLMSALAVERQGLENELLRSQIRRIDSQSAPAMPGPGTKYVIDGQGNTVKAVNTDAITFSQEYPDSKKNVQLGDIWQSNPYVSNAEDVQTRHGELVDMLWGGISIPADVYWNWDKVWPKIKDAGNKLWYETLGTRPAH